MHDQLVSKATVLAVTFWGLAIGLMISGWLVMLCDQPGWRWAGMLCASALMTTGAAVTCHIRCYILRILGLVRATAGLERERGELHSLP